MLVLVKEDVEERVGEDFDTRPPLDVGGDPLSSAQGVDEVRLGLQGRMVRPEVAGDDRGVVRGKLDGRGIRCLTAEGAGFVCGRDEPLLKISHEVGSFWQPGHRDVPFLIREAWSTYSI